MSEVKAAVDSVATLIMSNVQACLNLIIVPDYNAKVTEADEVEHVTINDALVPVSLLHPFSQVNVEVLTSPETAPTKTKVDGIFKKCLIPAIDEIAKLNDARIMRVGSTKETEQVYKTLAQHHYSAFSRLFPSTAAPGNTTPVVGRPGDVLRCLQVSSSVGADGVKTWQADIYLMFVWKGATFAQAVDAVNFLKATLATKGVTSVPISATIAVPFAQSNMLTVPSTKTVKNKAKGADETAEPVVEVNPVNLDGFKFGTTLDADHMGLPKTKKDRKNLLGSLGEDVMPHSLFSKFIA